MDAQNASSPGYVIRSRSVWWALLHQKAWDVCAFLLVGAVVLWSSGYAVAALVCLAGTCSIAITLTGIVLTGVVREAFALGSGLREVIPNLGFVLLAVVVLLASSGFTSAAWVLFCVALGMSLLYFSRRVLLAAYVEIKAACDEVLADPTHPYR